MPLFRKKPVVIEAVQFTGDNAVILEEFTGGLFHPIEPEDRTDDPDLIAEVLDKFHSTWVGVKVNQWIIRGVQGEFYPCDPGVLQATYDEVA